MSGQGDSVQPWTAALGDELFAGTIRKCREEFVPVARSFWLIPEIIPSPARDDVSLLYCVCRTLDDAVDEAPDPEAARRALAAFRAEIEGRSHPRPLVAAFRARASRSGLPIECADRLLEGMESDLGPVRIADDDALLRYAYRVSAAVGLLLMPLLGARGGAAEERVVDLGLALQISNILLGVREDAARGRVYLPATRLASMGLRAEDVLRDPADRRLLPVLQGLASLADRYYRSAALGASLVPLRYRHGVLLLCKIYREMGNASALNLQKLVMAKELLAEVQQFVEQVYVPDVCAIGGLYPEWFGYGAGVRNYLAVPDFPLDTKGESFAVPGGTILGGDLASVKPIVSFHDARFRDGVAESVARSWYQGTAEKHPYEGETVPRYTDFDADGKYSWCKAPRFEGRPMQVGPVAEVLSAYALGHEPTRRWAGKVLDTAGSIAKTKLAPSVLESTLGRHAARAIRCAVLGELALAQWQLLVDNVQRGDAAVFNAPQFPKGEIRGFGFHEAPRGTLSHWVVIRDGRIANYQAVVPSTWNAGPRDAKGQRGPYEASLVGNPIADPERPLEALRTIHSFDPCLACAVHLHDAQGQEVGRAKVL